MTRQLRRGLLLADPSRQRTIVLVAPLPLPDIDAWVVRNLDTGRASAIRSTRLKGPRFKVER